MVFELTSVGGTIDLIVQARSLILAERCDVTVTLIYLESSHQITSLRPPQLRLQNSSAMNACQLKHDATRLSNVVMW